MALISVKGLSVLMRREDQAMFRQNYCLGEITVVIDANSVMKRIYIQTAKRHDYFGGNYDYYANEVRTFFDRLTEVKVTPFVTFFGGHFKHDPKLVAELQRYSTESQRVFPNCKSDFTLFPLWLREVFQGVVKERGIQMVQFDFEDYLSTVFIAKYLKCPILADDPNYYLYNAEFIPYETLVFFKTFSEFRPDPVTRKSKRLIFYRCKIFERKNFLNYLGLHRDLDLYPAYAAIVASEAFSEAIGFRRIFNTLRVKYKEGLQLPTARELLSRWLKTHDLTEVQAKVEQLYPAEEKPFIWRNIMAVVKSYKCEISEYLRYFELENMPTPGEFENVYSGLVNFLTGVPDAFIEKLRKGIFPPIFVDIVHLKKCYLYPQVENITHLNTHAVSNELLGAIFKILTQSTGFLTYYVRTDNQVTEETLNYRRLEFPTFSEIQSMSIDDRRNIIKEIVDSSDTEAYFECLNSVPDDWKLVIVAAKVFVGITRDFSAVFAVIVCQIIMTKIDELLGAIRSAEALQEKYAAHERGVPSESVPTENISIEELIDAITVEEALRLMDKMVHHFEMRPDLRADNKNFDRALAHLLCEFQSTLLFTNYLNELLEKPYATSNITKIYNGTFMYNFTSEIANSTDIFAYVCDVLAETPVVLLVFEKIGKGLEQACNAI